VIQNVVYGYISSPSKINLPYHSHFSTAVLHYPRTNVRILVRVPFEKSWNEIYVSLAMKSILKFTSRESKTATKKGGKGPTVFVGIGVAGEHSGYPGKPRQHASAAAK